MSEYSATKHYGTMQEIEFVESYMDANKLARYIATFDRRVNLGKIDKDEVMKAAQRWLDFLRRKP